MDQAVQGNLGRLVNSVQLASLAQACSRARAGRSPPDQPLARIHRPPLELPSGPTPATARPILLRFLWAIHQRSSAATSSAYGARSTSLPSSCTIEPKIMASS